MNIKTQRKFSTNRPIIELTSEKKEVIRTEGIQKLVAKEKKSIIPNRIEETMKQEKKNEIARKQKK
jgi:hypothetical protein